MLKCEKMQAVSRLPTTQETRDGYAASGTYGRIELDSTLTAASAFCWSCTPAGWAGVVDGRSVLARMEGDTLLLEGPDETERDSGAVILPWTWITLPFWPAIRWAIGSWRPVWPRIPAFGAAPALFETLCTFILSQNNNIPRIRLVERLCVPGSPLEKRG